MVSYTAVYNFNNNYCNINLQVTKDKNMKEEIVNVTFIGGRIRFGAPGGSYNYICKRVNCWRNARMGGFCSEHSDGSVTHFFIKDAANPVSTFAFISSKVHASKNSKTVSAMMNDVTQVTAEANYIEERTKLGFPPIWIVVKKWVANDVDQSSVFEHTVRMFLGILFPLINASEPDKAKNLVFIKDRVNFRKGDLKIVKQMLNNCGIKMSLGDSSEYGAHVESPLLKTKDLKRDIGDRWIYLKFGTIGRLYVGKVQQGPLGPSPNAFIHPRHLLTDPDAKGIPLYQCPDETEKRNRKNTEIMEGVGQIAVILCEMLEGKVDGMDIRADFQKVENYWDWDASHLEGLKKLVGFFSGQELKLTVDESFDISQLKWKPVDKIITTSQLF